MVRQGDIELPDESHQERLYLDDTIQQEVFSVPRSVDSIRNDRLTRTATRYNP